MNIDQISKKPIELTRQLAALALATQFEDLPSSVQNESVRTFVNWTGCVLGGCNDPAVVAAEKTVLEAGAHPQASIVGRQHKTDVASAAFLNCLSSTVNSFDDTHLATVTHPTGPVAAAIFAYAEQNQVSGKDFLAALSIGIEIECRLSNVLLTQPAKANLGLFITGITGPIGAAAALGRLMKLDETQMRWAIGLAAVQASGFRGTHGAMAAFFVPAHAARTGVWGAMLARNGLTCTDHVLESDKGFIEIFAPGANLELAVQDWATHYEMLLNAYKPYPSGIVVQPIIDACLEIASQMNDPSQIQSVTLQVNPLAPNIPTVAESGLPGFAVVSWFGLYAPKGLPPALALRINEEVNKVLKSPEMVARFAALGVDAGKGSSAEFAAMVAADTERWSKLAKERQIQID